jgi:hypothetical protein
VDKTKIYNFGKIKISFSACVPSGPHVDRKWRHSDEIFLSKSLEFSNFKIFFHQNTCFKIEITFLFSDRFQNGLHHLMGNWLLSQDGKKYYRSSKFYSSVFVFLDFPRSVDKTKIYNFKNEKKFFSDMDLGCLPMVEISLFYDNFEIFEN